MDTKLKNTKTKTTKIVALVLAVVMFFASGTFASLFLRGFFNYNIFSHPENVTQTSSFRMSLNCLIWDLIDRGFYGQYDSYEKFLTSQQASSLLENYEKKTNDVAAAYDLLDKSGIEVYRDAQNRFRYSKTLNGVVYRFSYNGELITNDAFESFDYVSGYAETQGTTVKFTRPEVTEYVEEFIDGEEVTRAEIYEFENSDGIYYNPYRDGNTPKEIVEISEALNTLNEVNEYSCYGESSREAILAAVENNKINHLKSHYSGTRASAAQQFSYIDKLENISFAIIYKNGYVFSNCGVTKNDTREQVIQKLGNPVFAECIEGGNYSIIAGKNGFNFPDNIYSAVYNMIFGRSFNNSDMNTDYFAESYPDIDNIYISYGENGVDIFSIIEAGFKGYSENYSLSWLIVLFALSFIIACGASIYYLTVTGKTENGVKIHFYDKIPFEINWVLGLSVMALLAFFAVGIFVATAEPLSYSDYKLGNNTAMNTLLMTVSANASALTGLCTLVFFMIWVGITASTVRNFRNRTFTKYSVIFFLLRPLRAIWNWTKRQLRKTKYLFEFDYAEGKGKKFRVLAVLAVILFTIATMAYYWFVGLLLAEGAEGLSFILGFLGFIGDGLIVTYIILSAISLDKIMFAVSAIRRGEINTQIDMKYMPSFMKKFAEDILGVQDGLQNAVDSAVKDQKMKAELITNVSHDLKTPLTSIVNYVDLLKKCEIEDETAQKYVSILDEKAHKMKKLVEDLVEASKASSGAIEIHTVKLNLCEFATQAVGEHSDELKNYGIDIVLKTHESPVMVVADAQKVSRIAENLFSNIRKYALEGTRVYAEVSAGSDYGILTFKNISKHPLDISPDELTQRFVRGDASRSGEGSGLGLSIAKDLCELQGGRLGLQIDGDLFKATVALPLAKF